MVAFGLVITPYRSSANTVYASSVLGIFFFLRILVESSGLLVHDRWQVWITGSLEIRGLLEAEDGGVALL
jgi:hypothetical protein